MVLREKAAEAFTKFRLPLMILVLGLLLMLLPGGTREKNSPEKPDDRMQEILSTTEGVGDAKVLISDNGVVVVCSGAENPQVRLDIIRAIGSYTGFGSDRITVLKLADET